MPRKLIIGLTMLVLASLAACSHDLEEAERNAVNLGALQYANASSESFVSCSGSDSDGDGYVTCTTKEKQGATTHAILCSYKSPGCKPKD